MAATWGTNHVSTTRIPDLNEQGPSNQNRKRAVTISKEDNSNRETDRGRLSRRRKMKGGNLGVKLGYCLSPPRTVERRLRRMSGRAKWRMRGVPISKQVVA
jgi:hypothetical protein